MEREQHYLGDSESTPKIDERYESQRPVREWQMSCFPDFLQTFCWHLSLKRTANTDSLDIGNHYGQCFGYCNGLMDIIVLKVQISEKKAVSSIDHQAGASLTSVAVLSLKLLYCSSTTAAIASRKHVWLRVKTCQNSFRDHGFVNSFRLRP